MQSCNFPTAYLAKVQRHFHSNNKGEKTGLEAAEKAQRLLREKKRRVERELFWKRATAVGLEVAGGVLAVAISYGINVMLRKRLSRG